ncbi:MAG: helix-turn-helix domain-containing protein [Bacteroidia bacterium]
MSLYTTPLQFGYFFSLILWVVLIIRGIQNQRLSDKILGWIMFLLAMEMQDYTFGFAGINILWNELNGFPRGVALLFGPLVFLYFKAQINRSFTITKKELVHFIPFSTAFLYEFVFFIQGPKSVDWLQTSALHEAMGYLNLVVMYASYILYFYKCLVIYKEYRMWSENQFSDTEIIGFSWFRNFVYAMIFWIAFRGLMNIIDAFANLDFYQDWWWNLALVAVSIYIGLAGISQKQPIKIGFIEPIAPNQNNNTENEPATLTTVQNLEANIEHQRVSKKLKEIMLNQKLYLQPDLSLAELARQLKVSTSILSASINSIIKMNFNDYINALRVDEFIRLYEKDKSNQYTLISLAIDSGFNSKATFNRAFKKLKGTSPKAYFLQNNNKITSPL